MPFQTEDALNKQLDLCNTNNHVGRRTFHNDDCLKINQLHYKNRGSSTITYDFECIIKNGKRITFDCGLYFKSDYLDILEDKFESYFGEEILDWFVDKINFYN